MAEQTMLDLAHHIIAIADKQNQLVTNLKLHKIMYFSLQQALRDGAITQQQVAAFYNEPFQVWRYGPVIRSIYEQYKPNEASPIIENHETIHDFDCLNDYIINLLKQDEFALVKQSHDEPFWQRNQQYIVGWRSLIDYQITDIHNWKEW